MSAKRVAVVVCLATIMVGCSGADDGDTSGLPRFSPPPSAAPSTQAPASAPSDAEQIVEGYRAYTAAVSRALAEGDADLPALRASATGQAFNDARARVRANRQNGVVTTGALESSATTAEVEWPGGDQATIVDCLLNGLGHVEADHPDVVVAQANGTRRPVEAALSRTSNGWVVTRVEMPQDEDTANRQKSPPFLRGPMPDGPPSCAPPELEQELLARYQAFWDAFDRAFGFGRDAPANPDDPALAETQVNPQLSKTREFFVRRRRSDLDVKGEPDQRAPWVLAVTDFDKAAFIADCVTLGDSETVNLSTGKVKSVNNAGRIDYEETEMRLTDGIWKAASWSTKAEGLTECEPSS
jgi:hypothetical protein